MNFIRITYCRQCYDKFLIVNMNRYIFAEDALYYNLNIDLVFQRMTACYFNYLLLPTNGEMCLVVQSVGQIRFLISTTKG